MTKPTTPIQSDLVFFWTDLRDPECVRAKESLDEAKVSYTQIPCSGIYEPQIMFHGIRYEGLDRIKRAIGDKKIPLGS